MGAANDNVIQNCAFSHNFQAIFVSGSGNDIQNNSITDSYYQGAVLANMGNGAFSNNSITNAGMTFGLHRPNFTGDFYTGGIWLINGNAGCTIGNNTVTNIGNMGIRFNGTGITIERNQVENTMVNMPTFPSQIFEKRINFHLCGWKIHTAVKALTTWAS